jgi:hypothetical protein
MEGVMRVRLFLLTIMLATAIVALPLGNVQIARAAGRPADVRVVHALSDAGQADFYLNDIFAASLDYGQDAPYILVPPGAVKLRAFAPGTGPAGKPLFEGTFQAKDDQRINVALIGSGNEMKLGVFPIDVSPLAAGQGRVLIICSSTGWAQYTLTGTTADGSTVTLADKLAPGASVTVNVPVGVYTLKGNGLAAADPTLSIHANTIYSAFVVDVPGQRGKAADLKTFAASALAAGPAGFWRIVHTIPDAPAVDVYVGQTLIASRLRFGESTVHMAWKPGRFEVNLFAAGTGGKGTPLKSVTAEVAENGTLTSVVMGSASAPNLTTFTDDSSAPPSKTSRVIVFNARADAIDIALDGKEAVTGLGAGQISKSWDLQEGVHKFAITAGGSVIENIDNYSVSPNTAFVLKTLVVTNKGTVILSARPAA